MVIDCHVYCLWEDGRSGAPLKPDIVASLASGFDRLDLDMGVDDEVDDWCDGLDLEDAEATTGAPPNPYEPERSAKALE